jgi:hypothetical protein
LNYDRYSNVGIADITPHDTTDNALGVRYIQVRVAGSVVFRHKTGAVSVAVPIAVNQSFRLGSEVVAIHSTGTTATGIIPYYGYGV